jgi:hypothetical protein
VRAVRATFVAAGLVSLALALPAAAAGEPICHGQFAPPTRAEREQAQIQEYMRQRAEFGFRADEAYVRELIRRGVWEYDVGYIPVTPRENDYLRLRDKLDLAADAEDYLESRPDLSGGVSIRDDWPREPYILVHLTRDRAAHEANLKALVPFPNNLRTDLMPYSERQLDALADRIGDDADELRKAGFYLQDVYGDGDTGTAHVGLITARSDAEAYFRNRYGPVTIEIYATELTSLACEDAGDYSISRTGRSVVLHWETGHGTTIERVELVERDDRVELGIVERQPNGNVTAEAIFAKHRVRLSRPLGDRKVIDMADGKRMLQRGPSPGEPPCPKAKPLTRLESFINARKESGLPHGRAYVRRMLRRKNPYTTAEQEYLRIRETLEIAVPVFRYEDRHPDEFGGSYIEDHFPGRPVLVEQFTGHLRRHARNVRRLMRYPDQLRVVRTRWSVRELSAVGRRIAKDIVDGFVAGFGDAGFYISHRYTEAGRLVVKVISPRRDAARYFRKRYGRAVKVIVLGRRYECRRIF